MVPEPLGELVARVKRFDLKETLQVKGLLTKDEVAAEWTEFVHAKRRWVEQQERDAASYPVPTSVRLAPHFLWFLAHRQRFTPLVMRDFLAGSLGLSVWSGGPEDVELGSYIQKYSTETYCGIPLKIEGLHIVVAVGNPLDIDTLEILERICRTRVEFRVATFVEIQHLLSHQPGGTCCLPDPRPRPSRPSRSGDRRLELCLAARAEDLLDPANGHPAPEPGYFDQIDSLVGRMLIAVMEEEAEVVRLEWFASELRVTELLGGSVVRRWTMPAVLWSWIRNELLKMSRHDPTGAITVGSGGSSQVVVMRLSFDGQDRAAITRVSAPGAGR